MNNPKKLARIHRVRTLQLGLTRAEEMRAGEKLDSEAALSARIAGLVDAVSPVAQSASAFSLGASAHYRERLHQSALAAAQREQNARLLLERSAEATRAAKRDQSAVEKLMERARHRQDARERRALEDVPAFPRKRHDPC
ncbi:hypothetical protein SAMN05192583_1631 [Sphingomonas gellani]|uniref:Flagellar FliJ protein n=1 Tax=Sphingomonas gellani TaxID=1166340 RepID=A0A1H8CKR9_9SPHN|nr:hypothetical protein [Sphingomonas gellani]SEM95014.1 hypothetical protein SAMN05192583_1631 [Sphingomonas gellani]